MPSCKPTWAGFPKQRGYQYLLTDREGQEYELLLSGEHDMCSSIPPYGKIGEANPEERYEVVGSLRITSSTLSAMVKKERIDMANFQTLIIDMQGSESCTFCAEPASCFRTFITSRWKSPITRVTRAVAPSKT